MKKRSLLKRIVSLILSAMIMITMSMALTSTVSAADVTLAENNGAGLQAAINSAGSEPTTIIISKDFPIGGTVIEIPPEANITIQSDGDAPYTLTQASGRHFTVEGSLTLENIVLDGNRGEITTGTLGGVTVDSGVFNMKKGAVIQNCLSDSGAGVYVTGTNSVFTMYDGEISNNLATSASLGGGGIYMTLGGTFHMGDPNGLITGNPMIRNNTATAWGGGIYAATNSVITMYDGEISGNKALTIAGGGVYFSRSVFTMGNPDGENKSNPVIIDNTAKGSGGGVYANDNCQFTMNNGEVSGNVAASGGGFYLSSSKLTMHHGAINNNTVDFGGGVIVSGNSIFTMYDGEIYGNSAKASSFCGGGVYMNYGTFHMGDPEGLIAGNPTISGNIAVGQGGGVYAGTNAVFNMYKGKINGNTASATVSGGGVYVSSGVFNMYDGEISKNIGKYGGGVVTSDSTFTMGDSSGIIMGTPTISGNTAASWGGGVYVIRSPLTMYSGEISNNGAIYGGGVYSNNGTIVMGTGTGTEDAAPSIKENAATSYGGGVYMDSGTFTMNAGKIINNGNQKTINTIDYKSTVNGGGIYETKYGTVNITASSNSCNITGNHASGDGGGIYTADTTYGNLKTGSNTHFSGNKASAAYIPPEDVLSLYPDILFSSVSITDHPLNNYDINYKATRLITYNITYHANGGTGDHTGTDIQPRGTDTVLTPQDAGISRINYTFTGWNTAANGEGNPYTSGDIITLNENVTLYAQWEETAAPTEPIETAAPTEPIETAAPTEPIETATPTEPIETATPTEPIKAAAPTDPIKTATPTELKEPPETTKPTQPGNPGTGDNNNAMFWTSGLCISLAIVGILVWISFSKKRKEDNEK